MAVLDGRSSPSSDQESEISDILDLKNDEGWEDVEPDVESLAFVSFFDSEIFTDLSSLLDYMREKWDFDLRRVRRELGLDADMMALAWVLKLIRTRLLRNYEACQLCTVRSQQRQPISRRQF